MNNEDILQNYKYYVYGRHANRNTRHVYLEHLRVMFEHIHKPFDDITQHDLDRYTQHCLETKKTNGNSIRFWSINRFLEWSHRKDLVMPTVSPKDAGKLALNETETQKILDTIETLTPLHRLVFYLEYDTIRRPDEIRRLKLTDRYNDILAYDGKTGQGKAFMTRRLIRAWDDYVQHERPIPLDDTEAQYLILSPYGRYRGRHYRWNDAITRMIREICMYSHVELPQGQTPTNYLIKRTSITNQLKNCPDPKIVQTQAGHTKLQTTMKYNRVDENHIRIYLEHFEDKRPLFKQKKETSQDKSFLHGTKTPVDSLNKSIETKDQKSVTWSFDLSFSFSLITCSDGVNEVSVSQGCLLPGFVYSFIPPSLVYHSNTNEPCFLRYPFFPGPLDYKQGSATNPVSCGVTFVETFLFLDVADSCPPSIIKLGLFNSLNHCYKNVTCYNEKKVKNEKQNCNTFSPSRCYGYTISCNIVA